MADDVTEWPVALEGITESIVTTRGPNDRWNVAALGLHAGDPVTARTWGRTRTRRNFRERGGGYVQFTRDPVDFVDAACGIREERTPVLDSADAWARVEVQRRAAGTDAGTSWVEWALRPVEATVCRRVVPTMNRARCAVVEATIAASRLDVAAYDHDQLHARLTYCAAVIDRCGGDRDRTALRRLYEYVPAAAPD